MKNLNFLFVLTFMAFSSVFAQGVTVKGTVTDEKKETFPGVKVVVKGTANGVITDIDGKYTISIIISPNAALLLILEAAIYTCSSIWGPDKV